MSKAKRVSISSLEKKIKNSEKKEFFSQFAIPNKHNQLILEPTSINTKHFNSTSYSRTNNTNWMRGLSDEIKISQINIPGSHDSTAVIQSYSNFKNQTWCLSDQLKSGIRYLDIRIGVVSESLLFFHGNKHNNISFFDALSILEDFLTKNPSEFIIIRLKKETDEYELKDKSNNEENSKDKFKELVLNHIELFNDIILCKKEAPLVKQARGKIWILQLNIELNSKDWNTAIVQDDFWLDKPEKLEYKKKLIKKTLIKSQNMELDEIINVNDDNNKKMIVYNKKAEVFVNHFSAVGLQELGFFPYYVTYQTNEILFDSDIKEKQFFGILLFDFISEEIIERVIKSNYFLE